MDIEKIFYTITTTVTWALTVLTLHRLLMGWWRRYYLLALILILILIGIVPAASTYTNFGNWSSVSAQKLFWMLALASQFSIFLLVLQLIFRAGRELPSQAALIRWLTFGAITMAGISVFSHYPKKPNLFMTSLTRDMTFLSALLNMILWRFLLQMKKRDFLLLAVSAGLGIQCTGDAIGHSIRILGKHLGSAGAMQEFGNVVMALSAVLTIGIWHTAFSRRKNMETVAASPSPRNACAALRETNPATRFH